MKIVEKYLDGDEIREFRRLNDQEVKTLLGSDHASQQLLASVYGRWIYCDCCTPTTIKRFTETNTYFLATMSGRASHKTSCPLYRLEQGGAGEGQLPEKVGTRFSFSAYAAEEGNAKQSVVENPTGQVIGRADKLYSLMASLLTDAGTNTISYGEAPTFETQSRKIRAAAKKYSIGGKSLLEYMYFGFGSIKKAIEKMQSNERLWVGKNKPQSLVIAQVESVKIENGETTVKVKDDWEVTLPIDAKVTRLNGAFSLAKGPLMVAMIIADRSTNDAMIYGVTRCFISPIVNTHNFMLVDSDLERTFARVATRVIIEMEGGGRILKPLIPVQVDGKPVLVDFVIQKDKQHIAVEVMGKWEDPLYRARKETVLPLMEKVYDQVVSVGMDTSTIRNDFFEESYQLVKTLLND
ncbi:MULTISPECIES: DUF1173 family protein [Salinimonas]|uniref:DUF1173 family protein n=2 Tax=Salinimonas TaxID=288793 RepID=A0A5B7YI96_9ALTE|nr:MULTISPECIES: DUF1173 family protein [Salinimonas]MBD3587153.1 DUF1173 family protein [Salinimonas profundi]QCZ95377.1 DUF1173 family protein [Salinimonas iocasae]